MAETIRETIEEWLKKQYDSDLLEFAQERFDYSDHLSWSYHRPIEDYLCESLGVVWACDFSAACDLIKEALSSKEGDQVGYDGDPWDEDEVLKDIKTYYIDELVDEVENGIDWNGVPDVYVSIDTDPLYELLKECPEWVEEYDEDEE